MIPTFFALLVCAGGLFVSSTGALYLVMVFSLFGASAAIACPALGGANITPAVLFVPFLLARALRERGLGGCLRPLAFPNAGFWLMLVALWGVISAYFLPRIFKGEFLIRQVDRFSLALGTSLVPLHPVSTNITQSGYALGSVCVFIAVSALLSKREKSQHFRDAVLLLASLNCLACLINLAEFYLSFPSVLDYVRTGNYVISGNYELQGLMRLAGTFPETSVFAAFTLPLFAFTLSLWFSNVRRRYSGWITLASLFLLVISTSSTAYVALAIYMSCFGVPLALRALFRGNAPRLGSLILMGWALGAIGWVLVFEPDVAKRVSHFFDVTVFSKLDTESGIQRSSWNSQAWSDFIESYGIGVGLGSARASSFVLVLLSNVGIFGTLLFLTFVARVFRGVRAGIAPQAESVAARHAVFAALIAATVSRDVFDLGVAFYAFAAAASIPLCEPEPFRREVHLASSSCWGEARGDGRAPST